MNKVKEQTMSKDTIHLIDILYLKSDSVLIGSFTVVGTSFDNLYVEAPTSNRDY